MQVTWDLTCQGATPNFQMKSRKNTQGHSQEVIIEKGRDEQWTVDSGSSETCCRPSQGDVGRKVSVTLAGDKSTTAMIKENGEMAMEGKPILSLGRMVQLGGWSVLWRPGGELICTQLDESNAKKIENEFT